MDLSLITTFLDLASTGSFSKTAKRIHITQSAASARIKALEDSLECRLFTRERNGAKLTDAGQQFLSYAIGINRLWQQGRHDVAIRAKGVERIGIGVHLCVWRRIALQWMQAMRQHDTGLWLRLETDYSEKLIELVSDGILDLAVVYIPQALPGLKVEELFEDELILVSSVPCSFSPKLSAGYVYVDWSYGYRQKHAEALTSFSPFRTEIGNPEAALEYIKENGGSAFFPACDVQGDLSNRKLFRVQGAPTLRRPCYVVYPDQPANERAVALSLSILRRIAAEISNTLQRLGRPPAHR